MMVVGLCVALLVVLLIVHMARPRFERRYLSAARFFADLPPVREGRRRWRWHRPRATRPLMLQVLFWCMIFAAIFFANRPFGSGSREHLGLWLLLDTSASMSTLENGLPRMAQALAAVPQLLDRASRQNPQAELCLHLSTFDLEVRHLLHAAGSREVLAAISGLEARALGTDLHLVRNLFPLMTEARKCRPDTLVVLSDQPAPGWLDMPPYLVWQQLGNPVANVGFKQVGAVRDPLSGTVRRVQIEVAAYGKPPDEAFFRLWGPNNQLLQERVLSWPTGFVERFSFSPLGPGSYRMVLSPGDAYSHDDEARILIPPKRGFRVDWRCTDHDLRDSLAWVEDAERPQLRILAEEPARNGQQDTAVPTLIIASERGRLSRGRSGVAVEAEIGFFLEGHPLLEGLNLDVAEHMVWPALVLPHGFEPVLAGADGATWLAWREEPAAILLPGLAAFSEGDPGRISATVFFNGVRWLLKASVPDPLFTLTSPAQPIAAGNRLALHPHEGRTVLPARSWGDLGNLRAGGPGLRREPLWPLLLAAAAVVFALERFLAAYGGERWR